jgi:hypothetical protein
MIIPQRQQIRFSEMSSYKLISCCQVIGDYLATRLKHLCLIRKNWNFGLKQVGGKTCLKESLAQFRERKKNSILLTDPV